MTQLWLSKEQIEWSVMQGLNLEPGFDVKPWKENAPRELVLSNLILGLCGRAAVMNFFGSQGFELEMKVDFSSRFRDESWRYRPISL